MKSWQAGMASALLGIAIWQAIVTLGDLQKFILPGPLLVAETLWKSRVFILENAWITLAEVLLGLVLGALIGGISEKSIVGGKLAARRGLTTQPGAALDRP